MARRASGVVLAAVLVALGWSHGVLYVEGESMRPALRAGDVIVYRRYGAAPDIGDLAVFEHGPSLVVHRVVALAADGDVRTRGDANGVIDLDPVTPDAVRGTVVFVVPSGRLAAVLVGAER